MDKLDKVLKKLSAKERGVISNILSKLIRGDFSNLNLKKPRGYDNVFRVRKGNLRIIFMSKDGSVKILSMDRRKEDTYKF